MSVTSINKVLNEAEKIDNMWLVNPTFRIGELAKEAYDALVATLRVKDAAVETKRSELTVLMNERDEQALIVNDLNTRARSAARAIYGPDSSQYEQAGGTRKSERKPPRRKPQSSTSTP